MDFVEIALVVVVGLPTLASLVYGFWRDAHKSDEDRQAERVQLRLDKLRLELQLEAARTEIVRLNQELERATGSPRTHGGISASGNARINVGRDAVAGDKESAE